MTSYCPVPGVGPETPADRGYEGGFAAALMLKDLKLAMEAAQEAGAYTPMGGEAEELYRASSSAAAAQGFLRIIKMIDDSWRRRPTATKLASTAFSREPVSGVADALVLSADRRRPLPRGVRRRC
jgi:hypothetical protein